MQIQGKLLQIFSAEAISISLGSVTEAELARSEDK